MSRKVFTAGEVLAAADVNNFLMNQTVMSFAGTASRAASIPTPIEGMYTHLEDIDALQFWNGSAWRSPHGLTLVKQQTVGSGVTSVTISDAFSAAYEDYKVIYSGGVASGVGYVGLRFGLNGTPATGSNYKTSFVAVSYSTSGVSGAGSTNNRFEYAGVFSTNWIDLSAEIRGPFLARQTRFSSAFSIEGNQGACANGVHELATSYNDLIVTGGTFTGGTISVYGYRKD